MPRHLTVRRGADSRPRPPDAPPSPTPGASDFAKAGLASEVVPAPSGADPGMGRSPGPGSSGPQTLKEKATTYFKGKQYVAAWIWYTQALEAEKGSGTLLECQLRSNLAACLQHHGQSFPGLASPKARLEQALAHVADCETVLTELPRTEEADRLRQRCAGRRAAIEKALPGVTSAQRAGPAMALAAPVGSDASRNTALQRFARAGAQDEAIAWVGDVAAMIPWLTHDYETSGAYYGRLNCMMYVAHRAIEAGLIKDWQKHRAGISGRYCRAATLPAEEQAAAVNRIVVDTFNRYFAPTVDAKDLAIGDVVVIMEPGVTAPYHVGILIEQDSMRQDPLGFMVRSCAKGKNVFVGSTADAFGRGAFESGRAYLSFRRFAPPRD